MTLNAKLLTLATALSLGSCFQAAPDPSAVKLVVLVDTSHAGTSAAITQIRVLCRDLSENLPPGVETHAFSYGTTPKPFPVDLKRLGTLGAASSPVKQSVGCLQEAVTNAERRLCQPTPSDNELTRHVIAIIGTSSGQTIQLSTRCAFTIFAVNTGRLTDGPLYDLAVRTGGDYVSIEDDGGYELAKSIKTKVWEPTQRRLQSQRGGLNNRRRVFWWSASVIAVLLFIGLARFATAHWSRLPSVATDVAGDLLVNKTAHDDTPAKRPSASLKLCTGDGAGAIIGLGTQAMLVGGKQQSKSGPTQPQLVLDDANVDREHCEIHCSGGQFFVTDLQSRGGTFVNSRRIAAPTRLTAGDTVQIGSTVLEFVLIDDLQLASE